MELRLNRGVAIGNGNRPRGLLIAITTAACISDATSDNCTLAEGVLPIELDTLLGNPQLIMSPAELRDYQSDGIVTTMPPGVPTGDPDASGGNLSLDDDPFVLHLETVPLESIEGLKPEQVKPFLAAGMKTAADVYRFGDVNQGKLQSIEGVGKGIERAMLNVLSELYERFELGTDADQDGDPNGDDSENDQTSGDDGDKADDADQNQDAANEAAQA